MPKTLLLADDSVTIQKVVGISFASEDIDLVTVDNGDDAIAKAREVRPDIVLADVVMPGMNGYEVCEAIKSDPQLRHIPVLLLTGTFEAFDESRAEAAGSDGHITKPFEAQSLVDLVNTRLASAPAAPAAPEPALAAESTLEPVTPEPVMAREELTTIEPVMASTPAATGEPRSFPAPASIALDAGADTELPAEPAPPPVLDLPSAPPQPEALTTAMVADEDPGGRTEFGYSPAPAETFVAFPADSSSDLFGSSPGADLAGETDGEPRGASAPDPARTTDVLVTSDEPPADTDAWGNDASGDDASDLFAETAARFAPADGDGASDDPLVGALAEPDSPFTLPARPAPSAGRVTGEEATLDPDPARDYDVSVSDLRTPLVPLAAEDPLTAEPVFSGENDAPAEPVFSGENDVPAEPVFSARSDEAGPMFSGEERDSGEPVFSGELPASREPAFPAAPEPVATVATDRAGGVGSLAGDGSGDGDGALPMDDEQLRNRLHESLERIAWDAFGDVTERIVRQAVERIEKVAWEVIPQMAETLIREEIRRLKGED